MNKRVIITVTSDLNTDQRVLKLAASIQNIGVDVLLIGRKKPNSRHFHQLYQHKRIKLLFNKGFLFYAEYNIRLFFELLKHRADLHIACDTDTLVPNYIVCTLLRRKLIFDAHEIFPELPEVVNRKFVKAFWTGIESLILPKLKYSITVCDSLAEYYHKRYGIKMLVIRNVAYLQNPDLKPLNIAKDKKIILYQGALNVGRGLEWVIDCLPMLDDNCVLAIIGNGKYKGLLKRRISQLRVKEKVLFLGKILPDELIRFTKAADIGLCLLEDNGLSYYYSLPNRVFDYMQAGVPILASKFPEIEKIVGKYKTGVLIDHYEPNYLARTIKQMLKKGKESYKEQLYETSKKLCWENEQKKLYDLLTEILEKKK